MSRIYQDMTQLIGNTPIVEFLKLEEKYQCHAHILGKLEYLNPAGSVKDRAAYSMLAQAEKKGLVNQDTVIIEPTSGNTGIGIAAIAAARGYQCIFTMPETMSVERQKILKAYGAKIVLTDGKRGMQGAIDKASELGDEISNSFIPGQFSNTDNCLAHYQTTGPEIWQATEGKIDYLVSAVGTGGTITGIAAYLKEKNSSARIIAVEPASSPVISGGTAGPHKIQGIGAGFIPSILNVDFIDEVIKVEDEEAFQIAREVGKLQGILLGISSGAALMAAVKLAKEITERERNIVVILPDGGDRYFSTELYPEDK